MTEKLVILSDMWGVKKGLWITSYFGYLQQYYDIEFFDCQQLAGINELVGSKENLHNAFVNGGIETAVAHLHKKVTEDSHILAFSTGGTIAYKAALQGLPVKSLNLVSATRIRLENDKPNCEVNLLYGGNDEFAPNQDWAEQMDIEIDYISNFGHEMYTDEKIIDLVCGQLLSKAVKKAV